MKESVIYQEILAEGRQEGQQEATEKIALNLLHSGMRLEEVAKLTDLTIEQVQILRSRLASLENS